MNLNHRNEIIEALFGSPFPLSANSIFKKLKRKTIYSDASEVEAICMSVSSDTGFNPIVRHGENTDGKMLYGINKKATK